MFSNQSELHDLKAENERLRADVERLKDEISALEWFFGRAATLKAVEIQEFRRKHPTVFPDTK